MAPASLREEFVPSLQLGGVPFYPKKSRFSRQKCRNVTIKGVVGNNKPKKLSTRMTVIVKAMRRCDILYREQNLCDVL